MFYNKECCICNSRYVVSKCNNCKKLFCHSHLYTIKGKDGSYCDDCIIESYTCYNCKLKYDPKEIIKIKNKNSKDVEVCPYCFTEIDGNNYNYKIKELVEKNVKKE